MQTINNNLSNNIVTPDAKEKKEFVEKIRMKLFKKNKDFPDKDTDNDTVEKI